MDPKEQQRLLDEKKREVEEWARNTLHLGPDERFQVTLSIKDRKRTLEEEEWKILRSLPLSPIYRVLIEFFWERNNEVAAARELLSFCEIEDILRLYGRITTLNTLLRKHDVPYRLRRAAKGWGYGQYDPDVVHYQFFLK